MSLKKACPVGPVANSFDLPPLAVEPSYSVDSPFFSPKFIIVITVCIVEKVSLMHLSNFYLPIGWATYDHGWSAVSCLSLEHLRAQTCGYPHLGSSSTVPLWQSVAMDFTLSFPFSHGSSVIVSHVVRENLPDNIEVSGMNYHVL